MATRTGRAADPPVDASEPDATAGGRRPGSRSPKPPNLGERLLQPSISGTLGYGFMLWGFWLGMRQLADNSFFTHLATGRLILESRGIPNADPYSFTANGEPWVVQSWLASLLYGLVDSWSGGAGLRLLTGVISALIALLIWRLSRPANLLARVALVSMALIIGGAMWSPRPLLIGLALMGLTLLVSEGDVDPRWLAPAFWFWVNTHGSFPLGLVALAVLYVGRRLDHEEPSNELRGLKWALLGVGLAVINPLGPQILVFPIELLRRSDSLQKINEWQSPNFLLGWSRVFLLQIVVAVLALVRRRSWRGGLATVVFVAAALLGQRNMAVASMVLVLVSAHGLRGLGSLTGKDRSVVFAVAGAAMTVVVMAATLTTLDRPHYDLGEFPVDAVSWLDGQGAVARPDVALATNDTTGNLLELLYGTQARAFVDDRVDMYPKKVVDEIVTLLRGNEGWDRALDDRRVNVVLWERGGPLPELLTESSQWRVVYEDGKWMVACRRGTTTGTLVC